MAITLKVTKSPTRGVAVGTQRTFESGEIGLGRAVESDWVLSADPDLSRHHCRMVHQSGTYSIIDLSRNGVWINGERIAPNQNTALKDGDLLSLGEYELVIELAEPALNGPQGGIDEPSSRLEATLAEVGDGGPMSIDELLDGPRPPTLQLSPDRSLGKDGRRSPPKAAPPPDRRQPDGFGEFLKGVGIDRASLRSIESTECLRMAGETYRQAVNGICDILRARAQFKEIFRIEQTRLAAADNNPMKVTHTTEQALLKMLEENPAFKPAPEAMREALADIKNHQLALIAAVQVALTRVLEQIDPKALEERLGRSVLNLVPGGKQAQLWEIYEAKYAEIKEELTEDFRGTLGNAFADAYEKYINRS